MITLESYLQDSFHVGEGEGHDLVNPATGEVVAKTSTTGLDLGAAVKHARDVGGPALRALTFAERGALLAKMSKVLYEAREELIEVSTLNGGTTRRDGKFDIDGATGTLSYYAALGEKLGDRTYLVEGEGEQLTRSARFWGHHIKLPLRGVAVHINAFNFPAWGTFEKAAVALLAGVPVISKPATATALLAHRCVQKVVEADILPAGAFSFVCGSAGDLLDHLGSQDAVAFTGSGATAAFLRGRENIIARSVRFNVEADSLNAAILAPSTKVGSEVWDRFIRDLAGEVTQKTGQKCTATRRILVPDALADQVQEALAEELGRVKVGDPTDESSRIGPVATAQQRDDVRAGIDKLVSSGANIVYQSEAPEGPGFYIPITLLRVDDSRAATAVHEHEVFGPVSTLLPYESVAEAIELVALGEGALVTSVYGDDKKELAELVLGVAPYSGRVLMSSKKVAEQATGPGVVLPSCVHGGPGRAGGGEELGGLRGLDFYLQRTAVQGDRALLDRFFGLK